jgi:hypothetical protein
MTRDRVPHPYKTAGSIVISVYYSLYV